MLIYNIVNTLQIENNPGAAAIMATVLFLIMLGLTLLQMRLPGTAGDLCQLTCSKPRAPEPTPAAAAPAAPARRGTVAHGRQLHPADRRRHRRPLPDLRHHRQLAAPTRPAGPPAAPALPDQPAVARLHRGLERRADVEVHGDLGHHDGDHRGRPAGHLRPGRLRLRLPPLPAQAHALRGLPGHADDPARGHLHHQPRHHHLAGLVQHLRGARRSRSWPRGSASSCCARPSCRSRGPAGGGPARRLRPPALHDPGGRPAGPPLAGRARRLLLPRRLEPVPVAAGVDRRHRRRSTRCRSG